MVNCQRTRTPITTALMIAAYPIKVPVASSLAPPRIGPS